MGTLDNIAFGIAQKEEFDTYEPLLKSCEKSLIAFSGEIRYDGRYSKANQFTLKENSKLITL